MRHLFKSVFLVLCLLYAAFAFVNADKASGQPIYGSQIAPNAIQPRHLGDSLDWVNSIRVNDTTVANAAYASNIKAGVLTTGAFKQTTKDSLRHGFIRYADSAGVALGLSTGALNDSTDISSGIRDGIFGRNAVPWVYRSLTADYTDSSGYAAVAATALIADSAKTAPPAATCAEAAHAATADYATVAGTTIASDTTVGDSVVGWDAFTQPAKDSINFGADTSYYSRRTGSVLSDGIDALADFTTGMRSGYIPTADQKAALGTPTYGGAFTGANKPMDSLGFYNSAIVKNAKLKAHRIWFNLGDETVCEDPYTIGIDTVSAGTVGRLRWLDGIGQYTSWIDSANTVDQMKGLFPLKGTGNEPGYIYSMGATPTGTLQDVWFDTTLQLVKVKLAAGWTVFGGGGGGADSATIVVMHNRGGAPLYLNADSLAMLSRADTFLQDVTLTGAADLLAGDATTNIGTSALPIDSLYAGTVAVDTLRPRTSAAGTDSIYVTSRLHFGSTADIGNATWTKSPRLIYPQQMSFDTTVTPNFWAKGISYMGQVCPYATSTVKRVGSRTSNAAIDSTLWMSVNTRKLTAADCLYVWDVNSGYAASADNYILMKPGAGNGIKTYGVGLSMTNSSIGITNGSITVSAGGSIGIGSVALKPSWIEIPNDSAIYVGANRRYVVTGDQSDGLDSACNPSATNALVTKSAMNHGLVGAMSSVRIDSFRDRWFDLYGMVNRHLPNSCWDSSYTPDVMTHFVRTDTKGPVPTPFDPSYYHSSMMVWSDTANRYVPPPLDPRTPSFAMFSPPSTHNEYIVGQNYNDTLGGVTGYFSTIQAALDSIPNYQVKIRSVTNPSADTLWFRRSDSLTYGPWFYRGSVRYDTMSVIPDNIAQVGTWLSIYGATAEVGRVWTSTLEWGVATREGYSCTYCIVADTQVTRANPGNKLAILAKPWTVTIEPARDGNCWIGDSIRIMAYAPITIRGRGSDLTLLASGIAKAAAGQSNCLFYTPTTENTFGLPITISDMSLFGFPSATSNVPAIYIKGARATLRNIKGVFKSMGNTGGSFLEYDGTTTWTDDEHLLVVDHAVIAADSDQYIYRIKTYGCEMQSRNSVYSIGGSSSAILSCGQDMVLGAQFFHDQFYMAPSPRSAGSFFQSDVLQTDSITAAYCRASGNGPSATFLPDVNWHSVFIRNCSNIDQTANTGMKKPPVEIRDALFMLQTKVAVK